MSNFNVVLQAAGKCSLEGCSTKSSLRCASCKTDLYCCREHQQQHWEVHKSSCAAKTPLAAISTILLPCTPKFLLVSGLMFDKKDCFFTKQMKPMLDQKKVAMESINFSRKAFLTKLKSNEFSTCVVFQLGSGGQDKSFFSEEMRIYVSAWVKAGGKLILTGERHVLTVFNQWFGKNWEFRGDFYRRTKHNLNTSGFTAIPELLNISRATEQFKLPNVCNAKACMLSNVDVSERLYSPESGAVSASVLPMPGFAGVEINPDFCLIAVAKAGHGRVCFVGDVNAEESVTQTMIAVGTVDEQYTHNRNWLRRRNFVKTLSGCGLIPSGNNVHGASGSEEPLEEAELDGSSVLRVLSDFNMLRSVLSFL